VLPAFLTIWIRRRVEEPEAWARAEKRERRPLAAVFGPALRRRTVLAILLAAAVQFAYWGLFFWLPSFLASPLEQGGAGMTLVRSVSWIIPMQLGAYAGYLSFGFLADRFGRRRTCAAFLISAAILVPLYGSLVRTPLALMLIGPVLGFVGHGYFSMFGSFLAELFPTAVRATGQGLSYNAGRGLGALAPFTIGALATVPGVGIGSALALTSAFFLLGAALLYTLPDTSGKALEG
jgi:MFS family permease